MNAIPPTTVTYQPASPAPSTGVERRRTGTAVQLQPGDRVLIALAAYRPNPDTP